MSGGRVVRPEVWYILFWTLGGAVAFGILYYVIKHAVMSAILATR